MRAIFIALMVNILPNTTMGEHNIGMLVAMVNGTVNFYEGNPSKEPKTMTLRTYTPDYKTTKIFSIATDVRREEVYIMRNVPGDIIRLNNFNIWLNNSDLTETVFRRGVSNRLSHIAVDWIHGNVYWTDGGFHWIIMQSSRTNDTSMHTILLHHLQRPFGLAVDPNQGYMFWSEIGERPRITRATLSGEEITVLVHNGISEPTGIALDYAARRIYWTDGIRDTIDYMDYDGGRRQMLYRINGAILFSLFSYKDILCVSDAKNKAVVSFNKVTNAVAYIWRNLSGPPTGIAMFGDESQPDGEDVCADNGCDHLCVKAKSGAQCLCKNGYHIMDDATKCEEDSTSWKQEVVFALGSNICIMDVRLLSISIGVESNCPIQTEGDVDGISMDTNNGILFYHRDATVYRHAISISAEEKLVESTGKIGGMVYDWLDDNLYWTEQDNGRIMVMSLQTRIALPVLENTTSPGSITADPHESTLFWISGSSSQTIKSCNMDGSDTKVLASGTVLSDPADLTIDINDGRIYWLNSGKIKSMKTDGSGRQSEFSTSLDAKHIVTYKDYVIWIEESGSSSRLRTFTKSSKTEHKRYPFDDKLTALAVFDTQLQHNKKGPCWVDNGGCDHVCVPVVDTRECRCELGYTLQTDGITCRSTIIDNNFFLLSDYTHEQIYQVSLSNGDITALDIDNIGNVLGITYHEDKQKVYWSDIKVGIKSATLNSRTGTTLLRLYAFQVRRVAIDQDSGTIYYTASVEKIKTGYIAAYNEDLSIQRFLITELQLPVAIVLRPSKGVMYWTDIEPGKIYRSNMDGTDTQEIVTNLTWPNGLALDNKANKLYYVDGYTNIIGFVDLLGLGIVKFATDGSGHLRDIALDGGYLYYTGFNRFFVTKMNLNKSTDITRLAQHAEFGRLETVHIVSGEKEPPNIDCGTRNGQCTKFCLPTSTGRTCACANGVTINPDGLSCETDVFCSDIIQDGTLSPSCMRYEGEVCTFSCSKDYYLAVDNNKLKCEIGGEWNISTDGLCKETECEDTIANGQFSAGCSGHVGLQCDFKCDDGYRKSTETVPVCLTSKTWSVDMSSVCEEIECEDTIANGQFSAGCSGHVGMQCDFKCDDGYRKSTETVPVCLTSKTWSVDMSSVCEETECEDTIANGQFSAGCSRHVGLQCVFKCDDGYRKSTETVPVCLTSRAWSVDMSSVCEDSTNKLSIVVIIGISVGIIILIIVGVIIVCVILRNRRQKNSSSQDRDIQNSAFQHNDANDVNYEALTNTNYYIKNSKEEQIPNSLSQSDVRATESDMDGEQEYHTLNEMAIVDPVHTELPETLSCKGDNRNSGEYIKPNSLNSEQEDFSELSDYIKPIAQSSN